MAKIKIRRKPNAKKKRAQVRNIMQHYAKKQGKTPEQIAAVALKSPKVKKEVSKLLARHGIKPSKNPIEMSAQAVVAMNDELKNKYGMDQEPMSMDPYELEELENQYFDEIQDDIETGSEEMDQAENFLGPGAWEAVKSVGKKALEKVIKKRAEKGKGFLGMTLDKDGKIVPKKGKGTKAGGAIDTAKELAGEAIDAVKDHEKQKEMKNLMPVFIAIGSILLIVGIAASGMFARTKAA